MAAKRMKKGLAASANAKNAQAAAEALLRNAKGSGTVTVRVVRAASLPRADKNSSDPFVQVTHGKQKFKTKAKKKNLDPEWNESFKFAFASWEEAENATISVSVFDWDLIGSNDLMGTIEGGMSALTTVNGEALENDPENPMHGSPDLRTFQLTNETEGKDKDRRDGGTIILEVTVDGFPTQDELDRQKSMAASMAAKSAARRLKKSAKAQKANAAALKKLKGQDGAGTVTVTVVGARELCRADKRSSDPLVQLTYGKQKFKTTAKKKSLNPDYDESFTFAFPSWGACEQAAINVSVFDWDMIGSNDLMAQAVLTDLTFRDGQPIRMAGFDPTVPVVTDSEAGDGRTLELTNELTKGKDKHREDGGTLSLLVAVNGFAEKAVRGRAEGQRPAGERVPHAHAELGNATSWEKEYVQWEEQQHLLYGANEELKRKRRPAHGFEGFLVLVGGKHSESRWSSRRACEGLDPRSLFDPRAKGWCEMPAGNSRRYLCGAAVVLRETLLVMGGYDGESHVPLNTMEALDLRTKKWSVLPRMPTRRADFATVELHGRVVVIGGWDGSRVLDEVLMYNPLTKLWTKLPPMLERRNGCAASVLLDGRIIVVGGWTGSGSLGGNKADGDRDSSSNNFLDQMQAGYTRSAEVFDPKKKKWSWIEPMGTPRYGCCAVAMQYNVGDFSDARLIVAGGAYRDDGELAATNLAEAYDPKTKHWSLLPQPMSVARRDAAACLVEGKVIVAGGWDGNQKYHSSVESFDPLRNSWTLAPPLLSARAMVAAVHIPYYEEPMTDDDSDEDEDGGGELGISKVKRLASEGVAALGGSNTTLAKFAARATAAKLKAGRGKTKEERIALAAAYQVASKDGAGTVDITIHDAKGLPRADKKSSGKYLSLTQNLKPYPNPKTLTNPNQP